MLNRDFYLRDANRVAPELLGCLLVSESPEGRCAGIIVEVEAYKGDCDKGAHSFKNKRTPRTEIQFGPGGYAYIFKIYGMYDCFNIVTNKEGIPDVVLVRALEPVEGIALMEKRRGSKNGSRGLCSGPGKLCQALGISGADYGADLCASRIYVEGSETADKKSILVSPRVNIDYAQECAEFPWRYFIKDCPWVSNVPQKYRDRYSIYSEHSE